MTMLIFVITGKLFDRRVFFVVFGIVYTAVSYPWKIFAYDSAIRTYTKILSKDEIVPAY